MIRFASDLIYALGGTSKVARLMTAPISTMQNMRVRRITGSRLNHLCRIAQVEKPSIDLVALAASHGVELPIISLGEPASPGNANNVSAGVSA